MQEMWVRSLGWEDPLEKEMSTHSSILAWEITWTEEPRGLQCTGLQRVRHDLATKQQMCVCVCVCVCVYTCHTHGLWCLTMYACPRGTTRSKKWKKGTGYHEEVSAVPPWVTQLNMHQIHFTSIRRCLCAIPSYEAQNAEANKF